MSECRNGKAGIAPTAESARPSSGPREPEDRRRCPAQYGTYAPTFC